MDNDIDDRAGGGTAVLAPGLSSLSDDELTAGYDRVVAASRRAEWDRAAVEAEIDRRRMYVEDGVSSLREWICIRTGEGDRAASHQARVARSLGGYPALSAALADGRVSLAHVRILLGLAGRAGTDDDRLVELGETHTVPQLETMWRAARPVPPAADADGHRRRHLRWRWDDRGSVRLHGRLHGPEALTVTNLIAVLAETVDDDPTAPAPESFDTRCADALVELCTTPINPSTARRAEVVIHVPLHTLDHSDGPGPDASPTDTSETDTDVDTDGLDRTRLDRHVGAAMTWDGTALSAAALQRLLCDCSLRATVDDTAGRAVGIGFRTRNIPHWLHGQLRWRDGTCRFPGCERTRWVHGHHIVHWPHGPTNLANLTLLCSAHHRLLHEGGWTLHGHPDQELTFTSPTGHTHTTRPATHPQPPTRRRRRGPPGPTSSSP